MATAGIYCRVSSKGQAEDGASLQTQERECRSYCERTGLPVFHVYADAASAGSLDRRELDHLRDDIQAGLVSHVVALAWDRLSRDTTSQGLLLEEFQRHSVQLHFVQGGEFDFESDEAEFLSTMIGGANTYARRKIQERARRGRLGKARRGKVTLNDASPFAYRLNDARDWLEVIPAEAKVVRRIFELYTAGASSSLTAVCDALKGTPTPTDSGHGPSGFAKTHKKAPGIWNESSIRAILENRLYGYGEWTYRKTRVPRKGARIRTAPEDRVIVSGLPAIVSPDIQQKAQQRLKENQTRRDKTRKNPYPLSGFLRCGACGLSWTGFTTHYTLRAGERRSYRYYSCTGRQGKRSLDGVTPRCTQKNVRADHLENIVAADLQQWMIDIVEGAQKEGVNYFEWYRAKIEKHLGAKSRDYAAELADIAGKRTRLVGALEATGRGESANAIGKKLASLDDEEKALKAEQAAAGDPNAQRFTLEATIASWENARWTLPDNLAKFLSDSGSHIVIHPAGWNGHADRTGEMVFGATVGIPGKARSGVSAFG